MKHIEKSIIIHAPLRRVYNQWTQFEDFPRFMPGIVLVQQLDDEHVYWQADVYGKMIEWESEITEQIPDQFISWRSTVGRPISGAILFEEISLQRTRIILRLDYQPEGWIEKFFDFLGATGTRVDHDLRRFQDFIEHREQPTGGWRGKIQELEAEEVWQQWTRY